MTEALSQTAITIAAQDYDRLAELAETTRERMPALSTYLQRELARATIVTDADPGSVQMGSLVCFHDHGSGKMHDIRLVYPNESDMANGRLSVLTPVGSALLGVQAGDTTLCSDNAGRTRPLTVVTVQPPPT